jgi:hypothetical protein
VPRETELLNAVKFGHLATVDELIKAGVPAEAEVGRMSALWMAAMVGNDAIVARMLAAGAAPERMNHSSAQPDPRWNQRPMVAHPGLY